MRLYNVEGTKNHEPIKNNKTKLNKKTMSTLYFQELWLYYCIYIYAYTNWLISRIMSCSH